MDAFQKVSRSNFELQLVDLHQKLGQPPAHVSQSKFRGRLIVSPPFDHTNAADFYSKIDVLIAPSRIPESFGIAVREALLNGCYVIASRMGGIVEDLDGSPNAHLMNSVTVEELLAKIESILTNGLRVEDKAVYPGIASSRDQAEELLEIYRNLST
jgi:glycosyltransferase involved in cell wall biosynthesis